MTMCAVASCCCAIKARDLDDYKQQSRSAVSLSLGPHGGQRGTEQSVCAQTPPNACAFVNRSARRARGIGTRHCRCVRELGANFRVPR